MTTNENAPAVKQGAQSNLSKDTNITEDTQLLEKVEVVIPNNTKLDTTLTLPTWGISHLDYYIDHIAEIYNCPRDYVTFCVMSAVGTAIGTEVASYDGKFHNSTQSWGMIVGEQGCSKSEPLRQAFQPLYELDLEKYEQYKEDLKNWEEDNPKPFFNQTLLGDSTPEYKNTLLSRNKRGTNYNRDEMATKFAELNRYNSGSDIETELSIFNHHPITVSRKSEEPLVIPYPYMSQIGTIQPDILVKCLGNETFINSGYITRWLFVFPDNRNVPYYSEKVLDEKIVNRYREYIRYISRNGNFGIIPYTDEAKELYINYYNELQDKIKNGADNYEKGIYAKLQIHVQRWAVSVFASKLFAVDVKMHISGEIMRYSIDCMHYFEHTALKVRDMIYRNRNLRNPPKEFGKSNILREFVKAYPKAGENKQELANLMGVSRSQVSRELNKPD